MGERRSSPNNLPAKPLQEMIQARIDKRNRALSFADPLNRTVSGGKGDVCIELDIFERQLYGWESGDRLTVEFDIADRVLQRAGWLWWDVYTPESVRLPIFQTILRRPRKPKDSKGTRWWVNLPGPVYGDRGHIEPLDIEGYEVTDWAKLADIREAFTGVRAEVDRVAA
jgi:hypothetical protein